MITSIVLSVRINVDVKQAVAGEDDISRMKKKLIKSCKSQVFLLKYIMRRARITYPGAFHHVMNRGHSGEDIFYGNKNKSQFLDFLADASKKLKIRIFAYCLMNNHYHLVLENSSGKMSECLKRLNGQYGMYYRKVIGGKGYVFQGRFNSTLIDKDAYLLQSIAYLLRNPVRAGLVMNADDYIWSSIKTYYSNRTNDLVDAEFVNELFGTKEQLVAAIQTWGIKELPLIETEYGEVLGNKDFLDSAVEKYDRRIIPPHQSKGMRRKKDRYFDPVEKVIWEFEKIKGIKIEDIDVFTKKGARQRGDLIVMLKENGGLTYKEISEFDIFEDIKMDSLRSIYRNAKKRWREI
jgi:REP element-mobilizing transposase RayT